MGKPCTHLFTDVNFSKDGNMSPFKPCISFRIFCIIISIALSYSLVNLPKNYLTANKLSKLNFLKGCVLKDDLKRIKLNRCAKIFITLGPDTAMGYKTLMYKLFCYFLSITIYMGMCITTNTNRSMHDSIHSNDNDPYKMLKSIRVSNVDRLIIGHLNINSLRNKFEALKIITKGNLDILIITESKLDDTFPINQFIIDGFSPPFRVDHNKNSGGVIIYVRDDIPSRELKAHPRTINFEGIFFEMNLKKSK